MCECSIDFESLFKERYWRTAIVINRDPDKASFANFLQLLRRYFSMAFGEKETHITLGSIRQDYNCYSDKERIYVDCSVVRNLINIIVPSTNEHHLELFISMAVFLGFYIRVLHRLASGQPMANRPPRYFHIRKMLSIIRFRV